MKDTDDKNEPDEITEEQLEDVSGGLVRKSKSLSTDFSKGLGPLAMERVHEDE